MAAGALALMASGASAQQFSGGMPAGWACTGTCGTLGANGVVTLAPGGGTQYGYVSTAGGVVGTSLAGVGGTGTATDGSKLMSSAFGVGAGDILRFNFDYVTSDGAGFADYAWARLLDGSFNQVALLFTARTAPSGTIVPGFSMPAPEATLAPPSVPIIGSCATTSSGDCATSVWSPLGTYSGDCFAAGCGYTGWVQAQYTIATAGTYYLEFGVTNWNDQIWDSGMAFDGLTINNTPIGGTVTPEPGSLVLLATGFAGVVGMVRKRRKGTVATA
jgi:hypothetical protein